MEKIGPRDAHSLAAGYTRTQRVIEVLSILSFFVLGAFFTQRLVYLQTPSWIWILSFFIGLLSADFVAGFVHWAADTWGTVDWPIVGQSLIRSFREHHVDQEAITRHDFIETNGSNCLVSLPVLVAGILVPIDSDKKWQLVILTSTLFLTLWVFMTNQIHKWAHQEHPSRVVDFLQRYHLILPRDHHALHHAAPYMKHYCITTGWLNPLFARTNFFRHLERIIHRVTGAVPREDDLGKNVAENLKPI